MERRLPPIYPYRDQPHKVIRPRYRGIVGSTPRESLGKRFVKLGIKLIGVAALAFAGWSGLNIIANAGGSLSERLEQQYENENHLGIGRNGAIEGATAILNHATQTAISTSLPQGTPTPKH